MALRREFALCASPAPRPAPTALLALLLHSSEHYIGLGIAALVLLASCWNIITGLSVMHLPGPPKLPIFGNALSVMKEPWNQFARWHKQYGDIYTLCVPGHGRPCAVME